MATAKYTNVSKTNVFTTKGRCMLDETITLNTEEAKKYKTLVPEAEALKMAEDSKK